MSILINHINVNNVLKNELTDSEGIIFERHNTSLKINDAISEFNSHPISATDDLVSGISLRLPNRELTLEEKSILVREIKDFIETLSNLTLLPNIMEVLMLFMEASKDGNTALAAFSSKFSLITRDLASNVSDSIRKQGTAGMVGSIVVGATTLATSTIAARTATKGIGNEMAAAKAEMTAAKTGMPDVESVELKASAKRFEANSRWVDATGKSLSSMGSGITENQKSTAEATRKMEEHNSGIAQSIRENTTQEAEKVKELKEFLLKVVQVALDDMKQARDAAAMGCKI